ncbi:tyrosine-type recombinase/integrase [Hyphomicrobium sp.]|jgi:integrase|uniref:tyrosine-type recombinase/integrase n=1 Tax=Hyphomicrobium sp. TaxID=82 RepID=UPI00356A68EA
MISLQPPEVIERVAGTNRNNLSNIVPRRTASKDWETGQTLYARDGLRKYVNNAELRRVLAAAASFDPKQRLFAYLLAFTGARVSEVLALTAASFQIESCVVTFVTLKRRKRSLREVPIPPNLMNGLDLYFDIALAQQDIRSSRARLWRWGRSTAWRVIKRVMTRAGVVGRQASPRGLRHGFGVGTMQTGTALPIIQRWMGHSRLTTTAIYMNVCGPEEIALARHFWESIHLPDPGYSFA